MALDVVMYEDGQPGALTFAGGTCGNVLSILSYLRWASTAVGYLGKDEAGKRVMDDLISVGVHAHHLVPASVCTTPVFVQRLRRDEDGRPRHTFTNRCPNCGQDFSSGSLPGEDRPTPIRNFAPSDAPDVFFTDRLSKDILELAESAKSQGSIVFYEPSVKADIRHWKEAFALADVVKYSRDRFSEEELAPFIGSTKNSMFWEIQTLGGQGLRYRRHGTADSVEAHWIASPAIVAPRVVDTCGAGDWCSAGLLHGLVAEGKDLDSRAFASAVRLGQAFAALACAFVGARGAMYCFDTAMTWKSVRELLSGRPIDVSWLPSQVKRTAGSGSVLPLCSDLSCSVSRNDSNT